MLTILTRTVTASPTFSFSVASFTYSFEISDTCRRPSVSAPMSTNADTHAEIGGQPDYKDQVNGILPVRL